MYPALWSKTFVYFFFSRHVSWAFFFMIFFSRTAPMFFFSRASPGYFFSHVTPAVFSAALHKFWEPRLPSFFKNVFPCAWLFFYSSITLEYFSFLLSNYFLRCSQSFTNFIYPKNFHRCTNFFPCYVHKCFPGIFSSRPAIWFFFSCAARGYFFLPRRANNYRRMCIFFAPPRAL